MYPLRICLTRHIDNFFGTSCYTEGTALTFFYIDNWFTFWHKKTSLFAIR